MTRLEIEWEREREREDSSMTTLVLSEVDFSNPSFEALEVFLGILSFLLVETFKIWRLFADLFKGEQDGLTLDMDYRLTAFVT